MSALVLIICLSIGVVTADLYETPIIGIAAQELPPRLQELYPAYSSFIAASYVKAVESSGARVVPIPINRNESYYRTLLNSINGVVLPGGSSYNGPGHPYYDAVTSIYKIANEMNLSNKYFPILGICLGYEFLICVANEHKNLLMNCTIGVDNLPLKFTHPYRQTALFGDASQQIHDILSLSNVTANHHTWCALENDFLNSSLKDEWTVTSLSTSSAGHIPDLEFIATVEHNSYPYFGLQFHPEKIAFEWNPVQNYPHSREALIANRYFYDTLVNYAKKNSNKFESMVKEKRSLIYNYPARIPESGFYELIYLF